MPDQPNAFLSYTRRDDEFFGGAITSFRKLLELGVQVVTGQKDFSIFQEIDGVEFGQQWQMRLDQAIVNTRFLIPIITPLFFQSEACRDERTHPTKTPGRCDLPLMVAQAAAALFCGWFAFQFQGSRSAILLAG